MQARIQNDEDALLKLRDQWQAAELRAPREQTTTLACADHPKENEDRALCDPRLGIAAVFDGMGGEDGGEEAARSACGVFVERLGDFSVEGESERETAGKWLLDIFREADQAVRVNQRLNYDTRRQATTGIATKLVGDKVLVSSIGDSRAYRYSKNDGLERIGHYEAHIPEMREMDIRLDEVNTLEELMANKELLQRYKHRNVIDEVLGYTTRGSYVSEYDVSSGDLVFVCTDGIHDNLTGTEIGEIVGHHAEQGPQAVANALVKQARVRSEDEEHVRHKPDDMTVACLLVP